MIAMRLLASGPRGQIRWFLMRRAKFIRELESFQIKFTAAGNQVLDAGGAGHHADMAIACALAWFRSEQASQTISIGRIRW